MNIFQRTVGAFFLLLFIVTPFVQAQTAEAIVKSHLEALGGEDAIRAIKSIHQSGTVTMDISFAGTMEGTTDVVVEVGKRIYQSSDLGAFSTTSAWDGETAWERGTQGLRTLQGEEKKRLAAQVHVFTSTGLWASERASFERLDDEELDGEAHYVLLYNDEYMSDLKFYINKNTYLTSQTSQQTTLPGIGKTSIVIDYWDYTPQAGVMMAEAISVVVEGVFSTEIAFTETVINGEVDATLFAKPN